MARTKTQFRNRILQKLVETDPALVRDGLSPVELPFRKSLQAVGGPISEIYFVEHGIISVVAANGRQRKPVEVGLIGHEGCTGVELILHDDRSQHDVYVQVAGEGYRLPAKLLMTAIGESASFRRMLLRFAATFLIQVTETALANGSATIDARLARWLLMANDRMEADALPFTHEFLALMLGVRRAGVTLAIQELARDGLIDSRRGKVSIIDRKGLVDRAAGTYGRAHAELQRLLG
ncbi:MAG: Crp/Fnr family transcriptional regulator [Bauldia sp.]